MKSSKFNLGLIVSVVVILMGCSRSKTEENTKSPQVSPPQQTSKEEKQKANDSGSEKVGKVVGVVKEVQLKVKPEPVAPAKDAVANSEVKKEFKVWRTIKLGTGLKTADDFCKALKESCYDIQIGGASYILYNPAFTVSSTEKEVELVRTTTKELGFENLYQPLRKIYRQAEKVGLELCPPEVGPQLRLQYKDQLVGEILIIAMEPIADLSPSPIVYRIIPCRLFIVGRNYCRYDSEFVLKTDWYWTDEKLGGSDCFVFVLPRK